MDYGDVLAPGASILPGEKPWPTGESGSNTIQAHTGQHGTRETGGPVRAFGYPRSFGLRLRVLRERFQEGVRRSVRGGVVARVAAARS